MPLQEEKTINGVTFRYHAPENQKTLSEIKKEFESQGGTELELKKKVSEPPSWSEVVSDPRWESSSKEKRREILDKWDANVTDYLKDTGQANDFNVQRQKAFAEKNRADIENQQEHWARGAIPFHGAKDVFTEQEEAAKSLLGDNILSNVIGKGTGAMMALGTAFNPVTTGLNRASRIIHGGTQIVAGNPEAAEGIILGNADPTPWLKVTPSESVLSNLLQNAIKGGVSDPANTAAMIAGLRSMATRRGMSSSEVLPTEVSVAPETAGKLMLERRITEAPAPESVVQPKEPGIASNISDWLESKMKTREANIQQKQAQADARNNLANEAAQQAQAANDAIKSSRPLAEVDSNLPKQLIQAVKNADSNKVHPQHTQMLVRMNETERPVVKKLHDSVEEYSKDFYDDSKDPLIVVGEEITKKKIGAAEKIRQVKGEQLGEITKTISKEMQDVANEPLSRQQASLSRMEKIPSLDGIKLDANGKLDFSDTRLNGPENIPEQKLIQDQFDSLQDKTPYQLWKRRQGIRESLESAKKSKNFYTETTDQALEAIRGGIMDYLDTKSPDFKKASSEYSKVAKPLEQLESFVDVDVPNSLPENLLVEKNAAVLARRLTGLTKSGQKFEGLLKNVENALRENGVDPGMDATRLQKAYNIFSEYYPEIKRGTSAEAIVERGVASGLSKTEAMQAAAKFLSEQTVGNFSKTQASRRAAIKDLVDKMNKIPSVKKGDSTPPPLPITPEQAQILLEQRINQQPK